MVDATLRSIYFAADETIEMFDRLQSPLEQRRTRALQQLESVVAGLDGSFAEIDEAPVRRERPADRRAGERLDREPFVALPKRTTHGGDWGPKVAEKLRAEALRKLGW